MKAQQYWHLVGFECRKAFWNPGMVIFFAVLLLFNGWKIRDSYTQKVAYWDDYEAQYAQTYEKYSGEITAEKISDLMTVYAPLEEKKNTFSLNDAYDPDAYIYSEAMDEKFYCTLFYTELKYDYLYRNEAYRITRDALALNEFYESIGNSFEATKNRKIAETFLGRSIDTFSDTRGYEVLLNYDYSAMLILLLSIFALCGVFVNERETDMYMLLRTTRNGADRTVVAKLTASILFVLVVCTVFFAQDFLTIYFASPRNEALQAPVYALRTLESTPLNMTVGQFFLWSAMVKTLGILACCAMLLLISSIFKTTLGAFFTGLLLLLGCVALQEFSKGNVLFRWCNPVELVIPRSLIWRDVYVNILGTPMRLYAFVLIGVMVITVAMICGIVHLNRSYHHQAGRSGRNASV